MSIFISYAREDVDHAELVYKLLKDNGLNPWMDKHSLFGGENWVHEIDGHIEKCRYFVLIISSHTINKVGQIQREIRLAKKKQDLFPDGGVFIIPLRVEDCEVKDRDLRSVHYIDMFPDWKQGEKKLISAIEKNKDAVSAGNYINNEISLINAEHNSFSIEVKSGALNLAKRKLESDFKNAPANNNRLLVQGFNNGVSRINATHGNKVSKFIKNSDLKSNILTGSWWGSLDEQIVNTLVGFEKTIRISCACNSVAAFLTLQSMKNLGIPLQINYQYPVGRDQLIKSSITNSFDALIVGNPAFFSQDCIRICSINMQYLYIMKEICMLRIQMRN